MMEVRERLILILLYLIIASYGLLALSLIAYGIMDLSKGQPDRGSSIRPTDESRTAPDRRAAFRKRGWANTWLPGNIENLQATRTPNRRVVMWQRRIDG
jgi:hypothetical protein